MIVSYSDILEFTGEDDSQVLESTHAGVEQAVKAWMKWDPESVDHVGKLIDGTGFPDMFLHELHIQRVDRVAVVAEEAIGLINTSDSSTAYVQVTDTGIRLVVDDGTNVDDTTTDFADYATITLMVAQLNTIGKGWTASVYDSDFGSYNSNTILQTDGYYLGAFDGATAQTGYLNIAGEPIRFNIYKERGIITRATGSFPAGSLNIAVNYTSGWTAAQLQDDCADLQDGIKRLVKLEYAQNQNGTTGLKSYTVDGVTEVFDTGTSGSSTLENNINNLIPYKYKKVA